MEEHGSLLKRIPIPQIYLNYSPPTENISEKYWGGDIRIGDLTGDGKVDFVVYKSIGGMKPCFIGAFNINGEPLWQYGEKNLKILENDSKKLIYTESPSRPGPILVYDIDQDGRTEVICLFADQELLSGKISTNSLCASNLELLILDGETGKVKKKAQHKIINCSNAYIDGELHLPNYVHQRILAANFSGNENAQDFLLKIANNILAFNHNLELLWHYENKYYIYSKHASYIPAVGDLNKDGLDEVNGGHFGLNNKGEVIWEKNLGLHLDSVIIDQWDEENAAIISGGGQVLDKNGDHLLELGHKYIPHGQEVRFGKLSNHYKGKQLVFRYNGHTTQVMVVTQEGEILSRFDVDESPNNTGLEIINWDEKYPGLIYSPVGLYNLFGEKIVFFPDLPDPTGGRMGWYHCLPINLYENDFEEIILYDPYSYEIFIYGSSQIDRDKEFFAYKHTPRQFNPRIMD